MRHGKTKCRLFSDTIHAAMTEFGTVVLFDQEFLMVHCSMTFTEGQGHGDLNR